MTIPSTTSVTRYTAGGSDSTYAFTFKIQDDDDVEVVVTNLAGTNTTLTKTTNYTVSGVGASSGSITLLGAYAPLTASYKLTLRLRPAINSSSSFRDTGRLSLSTLEDAMDRMSQRVIRLQDEVDRCLKIPLQEEGTSARTIFGSAADRASQYIGFNASGDIALGAAVSVSAAPTNASYVTLATDGTLTAERVLTGTSNQITVTDAGAGSTVTLSLPSAVTLPGSLTATGHITNATTNTYDLGGTSNFWRKAYATDIRVNALTASSLVATDSNKDLTSSVSGLSPTFTALTLSGLTTNRVLYNSAGVITSGFFYNGTSVGIGTTGPDRILDVLAAAAPQLRLTQADGTVYSEFQTDSSGFLNVVMSGYKLALINGTNSHTFEIYAMGTLSANYSRLQIIVNSSATTMFTQINGAGTGGQFDFGTGTGVSQAVNVYIAGSNVWRWDTSGHLIPVGSAYNVGSGAAPIGSLYLTTLAASYTMADSTNIALNTSNGTKIGTGTTQKLGFYNATPVVQWAAVADAAGGATVDAEARTAINTLLARIRTSGLLAT